MIPYEVDHSLHPAEPMPPQLGDGFSPPDASSERHPNGSEPPADPSLWRKSEF